MKLGFTSIEIVNKRNALGVAVSQELTWDDQNFNSSHKKKRKVFTGYGYDHTDFSFSIVWEIAIISTQLLCTSVGRTTRSSIKGILLF